MRGIPNNAVACVRCAKVRAARPGELCQVCKMTDAKTKYRWTPEEDEMVRRAYQGKRLPERAAAIRRVASTVRRPRDVVRRRGIVLGVTRQPCRPWTAAEVRYVEESVGSMPAARIARVLGRSYLSVVHRIQLLGRSQTFTKGYTRKALVECLGVALQTVQNWIARDWLRVNPDGRVSDVILKRFLHAHPEAYDLRRVDQFWFKSVMFPQAACYRASAALEQVGSGREEREERSA